MRTLIVILALFITVSSVYSQTFPESRDQASLIYHPPSKGLLFMGGFPIIQDSVRSDVWKWDGKTWAKTEAKGPGSRAFFQGTLNSNSGEIFHFGGNGVGGFADSRKDLWAFNGKEWLKKPIDNIGVRHHHRIVYADHLDAIILYGGFNAENKADTATWIIKNGKCTPLHIPGPGIRYQYGMVYDKNRKKVVLYGGGDRPDEHWEFDGKKWEKIITAVNPGIKFHHHMTYDENTKAVILHGGWVNLNSQDSKNWETPVTWMWDGKVWKKIAQDRMFSMGIAYEPNRKSVIAYGYTDGNLAPSRNIGLWELKNGKWTNIADYGKWNTLEYLAKYLETKPNDLMALMPYANALRNSNRLAEAETVFRKIESTFPPNPAVTSNLIDVMLRQNKFSEAEEYISKVEQSGQNKRQIYTRAAASLYSARQYSLAASYYEKALAIEKNAEEYYNLGCIYALMNEKDKAFANLNQAVDLGSNSKRNYESDPDLQSLRSNPMWYELAKKLK